MPVGCTYCGTPIDDPIVRVAHQDACGLDPARDEEARARYDDLTERLRRSSQVRV